MDRPSPLPRLRLLGHFVAESATGVGVILPKKAQALLAYLLVHRGRHVPRDEVAALLWSNSGSEQARQSLRQCVSVIRKALPGLTLSHSNMVGLAKLGAVESDIDEVASLEASGSLSDLFRADELFRGEFVAGLALDQPFDDWAENERRRLEGARMRVLSGLAKQQADANDMIAAVETARRLTAVDPLREESSRLLMKLLAASNQRGLALVEYARIKRLLKEELQVTPDSATQRIAQGLRLGGVRSGPSEERIEASSTTVVPRAPLLAPPDRPTMTVLPFSNLGDDPSDDYFVQGLCRRSDLRASSRKMAGFGSGSRRPKP